MKRQQIKKDIFMLLAQSEPALLPEKLLEYRHISVINTLFMALCDTNERVRWHAVSCFGDIVSTMAKEDTEAARVIMRRFLWTLNDESGGIGWGAPEAMAQIMCRSTVLRNEYVHMLISYIQEDGEELYQDGNYLELPLLQRGLLWGIGTLCYSFPQDMKKRGVQADIIKYLYSEDATVCRLALWVLVGLGAKYSKEFVLPFYEEDVSLTIFKDHTFKEVQMNAICDLLSS